MRMILHKRTFNVLFCFAILILIAFSVLVYKQMQNLYNANEWVIHTYQVRHTIKQVLVNLSEASDQLDYYIISGDKVAIQKYTDDIKTAKSNIANTKFLTRDNYAQQMRLQQLELLFESKTNLMNEFLRNHLTTDKKNISAAAENLYRTKSHLAISQLINIIDQAESLLLDKRNYTLNQNIRNGNLILIITDAICFILLSLSYVLLNLAQKKRDLAEIKLRENESHKTAILEAAFDSIININAHGTIISYNKSTSTLFGYLSDDLINKNINTVLLNMPNNFSNLGNVTHTRFLGLRKDGEYFPVELTISGVDTNNFVIIVRDIIERKKADTLKNEFISVVSHELRTPLTSIQGSLDLLKAGTAGKLPDDAIELITIAQNNSERLIRLINDILDIEKIESGRMSFKLVPTDLNKLLSDSIKINQAYADKFRVKILLLSHPHIMINIDHDKFLQVMTNLISNAVKFTPQLNTVSIKATLIDSDNVRIEVIDKGPGISNEFQKIIFQKFAQEDSSSARKNEGTGLGLSISKAIIEKMQGKINFETTVNSGTTFYFDLPIYKPLTESTNVISDTVHV